MDSDGTLLYRVHAAVTLAGGIGLTFFPRIIIQSEPYARLSRALKLGPVKPQSRSLSPVEEQQITSIGILMAAIGICYLPGWNIPVAQNAFLYASVPIRLSVAVLAAVNWIVNPKARDLIKAIIVVEDGLGALILGWMIGSFKGSPPL